MRSDRQSKMKQVESAYKSPFQCVDGETKERQWIVNLSERNLDENFSLRIAWNPMAFECDPEILNPAA